MNWRTRFGMLLLVGVVTPLTARAGGLGDEPASKSEASLLEKATKAGGVKGAKKIAGKISPLISLAEMLDEATKTTEGVKLKSKGSTPVREGTYFGVKYTVPGMSFTDSYTNTVFGEEVPGRRVTATITLDCEIDCQVMVDDMTFAWSKEKPKTLIVTLPPITVIGSVPKDRTCSFEVDYGFARSMTLNKDDAKELREQMRAKAGAEAAKRFKQGEAFKALQEGLQSELHEFISAGCPKDTTVTVVFREKK